MNINFLFENINDYLADFNKKYYEKAFEKYQKQAAPWFEMLDEEYSKNPDVKLLCENAAKDIVDIVSKVKIQTSFKNRNQEEEWQNGLNLFMVAYVIPAVFELRNDYYKELPKYICMSWMKAFPGNQILPGTFEVVNSGFQKKPFGFR